MSLAIGFNAGYRLQSSDIYLFCLVSVETKNPKIKKKWLHWFFQVRILLRDDDGGDLDDDGDEDGDKDENDDRFYLSRFRSVNFTQV
jgi:hypothetical protein